MKAGVISPYFKTLGGGERYALTFAEALLKKGWNVDITLNDKDTIDKAAKRFNLALDGITIKQYEEFARGTFISRFVIQKKYDLLFWVSDGSVPLMFGKKNLLHFQIPFHGVQGRTFQNSLKFRRIAKVVCNSNLTKKVIDKEFGIRSEIWYPPVDVDEFISQKKENYVLAVGRFEKSRTEKKQDVLIEAFKKMVERGLKNWKFVLAGGFIGGAENDELLSKLRRSAEGFPIDFKINVPFPELKNLYSKAKIFWHAAGFGTDEEQFPEKTEHFGITTVEAMASGCIPVVINKGGQKEIVENNKNGFLWANEDELIDFTLKIIKDTKLSKLISKKAIEKSKEFSKQNFYDKVYNLINE